MTLAEVSQQLKDNNESIILIYAFNSTGKTQLCVAYKNLTKAANNGSHTGVYYNAYSEDLFVWDNDEDNDNANIKLDITFSSLNQFHNFLITDPNILERKLAQYNPNYDFFFNENDNPEQGIESITFAKKGDETKQSRKISRGEERIFVWSFFLALFEVDAFSGTQDAHFFIDDPVSSLDDHNIFITADSIMDIVDANYLKKRIILTTHHIGLFSILFDRLKKGGKSDKYKKLTKPFILSNKGGDFTLKAHDKDVFLFHLHLLQTLEDAIGNKLYVYHFVLLRQVLENITSFLGTGKLNHVLTEIGVADIDGTANMINSLSHQNTYSLRFNEMQEAEETLFKEVFGRIMNKYNFILH
jgi:hypothetical protein